MNSLHRSTVNKIDQVNRFNQRYSKLIISRDYKVRYKNTEMKKLNSYRYRCSEIQVYSFILD
jgi:hypothetical protein